VRARVDVPNPDRGLKAGVFVRARIEVSDERDALVVPREAVEYAEGQPIVFVRESETVYLPVPVELGGTTDGRIEIRGGVDPGARVVTTGAFLLKTEILKESIGAGCCEEPSE
jgi:cobalt-zinc-cadmium efflux system membrane fusion protein